MPERSSYDYAILRVVPHVEREEFINVGVILFCRTRGFLGALIHLDERRLLALASDLDLEAVRHLLAAFELTCAGRAEAGSIGCMSPAERFHWLVSPRSTMLQTSPVHCGLTDDPEKTLRYLLKQMVCTGTSEKI